MITEDGEVLSQCYDCGHYMDEDDIHVVLYTDGLGSHTFICVDCEKKMARAHGVRSIT